MKNIIKISILKDEDKYAYMEYQSGNDPLIYNDTYGNSGYWTLAEVCESVIATYEGHLIEIHLNIPNKSK
jgi:hypothetical protein